MIGTNKPDFNFTGLYTHPKSGLDMAAYRFYDPDLGRWLNRDPSGENGGLNLYRYGANNPSNLTDPAGLCPGDWWDLRTWFNEGLTDSLGDTWTSLQDSTGDFLTGNWDRLAADAATNPLGQTENNPMAYTAVWTGLGVSATAVAGAVALDTAGIGSRVAFDGPYHVFDGLGPRSHLQLNIWRVGVKGSGSVFRIPIPPW